MQGRTLCYDWRKVIDWVVRARQRMNETQNVMFFRKKEESFPGKEYNQKNNKHTGILICYIKKCLKCSKLWFVIFKTRLQKLLQYFRTFLFSFLLFHRKNETMAKTNPKTHVGLVSWFWFFVCLFFSSPEKLICWVRFWKTILSLHHYLF